MTTFQPAKHMRNPEKHPGLGIFTVILLLFLSSMAQADWNHFGYLRIGTSFDPSVSCFQLPGAKTKYRLGNECDNYGEIGIEHNQAVNADYTIKARLMGQIYFPDHQSLSQYDTEFNQYMIEAKNTATQSVFHGSRFWIGKRFYRRHDVYITDFFYWANNGTGLGIENFKLGKNKLAYAHKTNALANGKILQSHDLQLYDIALTDGHVNIGIESQSADQPQTTSGLQLHAQYHHPLQHNNFVKITAQYGEGLGANLDMNGGQGKTTRLIGQSLVEFNPHNALFSTLVYEKTHQQADWVSLGFRCTHFFTQHYSVAGEIGHDQVSPVNETTRTLNKITLSLQWTPKPGFWERPALRLFTTYGDWNLTAQQAGLAGGTTGTYGADRQGFFLASILKTGGNDFIPAHQ